MVHTKQILNLDHSSTLEDLHSFTHHTQHTLSSLFRLTLILTYFDFRVALNMIVASTTIWLRDLFWRILYNNKIKSSFGDQVPGNWVFKYGPFKYFQHSSFHRATVILEHTYNFLGRNYVLLCFNTWLS